MNWLVKECVKTAKLLLTVAVVTALVAVCWRVASATWNAVMAF